MASLACYRIYPSKIGESRKVGICSVKNRGMIHGGSRDLRIGDEISSNTQTFQ